MKIAIIGCTHAGTITANQVLTNHPDVEVTIYEKNNNISLSNSIVYNELNGRVVQKELNFKVLKSGKFFKYQVLNIKTLDN